MASLTEVIYTGLKFISSGYSSQDSGWALRLTADTYPNAETEQAILTSAVHGDKEAFGEIVTLYMKKAYFAAYSYLHNEQDALDISQDAFIRAFKHIHRFDLSKPFFPWLYRIIRNLCLDQIKKQKRHPTVPLDALFNLQSSQNEMFANEDLWNAIDSLSEDQKEIIMLRFFQGYSYQEIADLQNKPIGSIMSALHYIKKKLGKFLKQERAQ